MSKETIYLDYNATAPVKPSVRAVMTHALSQTGNPSSIHGFGRAMRKDVERAREQVAAMVNAPPINVTFTSGATEANNTVIYGTSATRILISAIEHPSIYDVAQEVKNIELIPVTPDGVLDLDWLQKALATDPQPTLISVMMVNNETGVIQPIQEIVALAKAHGSCWVHSDAVQAAGRMSLDMTELGIDYLSLSAHKLGGPMGVGALIYNHDKEKMLAKMTHGGGQERGRRAGTENAPAMIGFGYAAELAVQDLPQFQAMQAWREDAEQAIQKAVPAVIIYGQKVPRVANTIQLSLPGIRAETQLMALDLAGIAVSSGAACSSGSIKPSHVLQAMGATQEQAKGALRCSFGWNTTQEEIKHFTQTYIQMAKHYGF